MREYLRHLRAYLYTGTNPASYTLGLIEALMTGVPTVSIGPAAWARYAPWTLFEGHELAPYSFDDPAEAREYLWQMCLDPDRWDSGHVEGISSATRERAIELFGIETVSAQWASFLGVPVREAVAA